MSEYDITTGYLFRQFPADFVKFTAGDATENIKLADPVLKQVRYADATAYATIFSEDSTETEVIVHLEFQTDADNTMPIRMAGYIGRLIDMRTGLLRKHSIDDQYMQLLFIFVRRKLIIKEFISTIIPPNLLRRIMFSRFGNLMAKNFWLNAFWDYCHSRHLCNPKALATM
nr:hypothetical protein [bacterium]